MSLLLTVKMNKKKSISFCKKKEKVVFQKRYSDSMILFLALILCSRGAVLVGKSKI